MPWFFLPTTFHPYEICYNICILCINHNSQYHSHIKYMETNWTTSINDVCNITLTWFWTSKAQWFVTKDNCTHFKSMQPKKEKRIPTILQQVGTWKISNKHQYYSRGETKLKAAAESCWWTTKENILSWIHIILAFF